MKERFLFRGIIKYPNSNKLAVQYNGKKSIGLLSKNERGLSINNRPVDPDTIGQCTGLKDKNGKLIFEGDILKFPKMVSNMPNERGCVYFGFKSYEIKWVNPNPSHYHYNHGFFSGMDISYHKRTTILGNIYDNPELLKWEVD